jgi:hypothetical protein
MPDYALVIWFRDAYVRHLDMDREWALTTEELQALLTLHERGAL